MDSRAKEIVSRFKALSPHLNERGLRVFAATEASIVGRGGVTLLHRITGLARSTIQRGLEELAAEAEGGRPRAEDLESIYEPLEGGREQSRLAELWPGRIRRPGGGRKKKDAHSPDWAEALEKLVDPVTRGILDSPLRWTTKSTKVLSEELLDLGFKVAPATIGRKLVELGYDLNLNRKNLLNPSLIDKNTQLEYINLKVSEYLNQANPVISIDTKKLEFSGNFRDQSRNWSSTGPSRKVNEHDLSANNLPRALPFGIYDINNNISPMIIESHNDTSEFVTNSLYGWWQLYGSTLYPNASKILMVPDCADGNRYGLNLVNYTIQNIVDKIKIPISINYLPPGTIKWNNNNLKLFSFASLNWQNNKKYNFKTHVKLISPAKIRQDKEITCLLDFSIYQSRIKLSKNKFSSVKLTRDVFHGDWNYTIEPH